MVDGYPCVSYICSWERQLVWTLIHFTGLLPRKSVNLCSNMRMRLGILGDNSEEDVIAAIMVVTKLCQKQTKKNKSINGLKGMFTIVCISVLLFLPRRNLADNHHQFTTVLVSTAPMKINVSPW